MDRRHGLAGWVLLSLALSPARGAGQSAEAKPVVGFPSWLAFRGEARARFEALSGQFRAGAAGNDRLLLFRTLFLTELRTGPAAAGLEIEDGRTYFADGNTPLGPSFVDPFDILQGYVRFRGNGVPGRGWKAELKAGRQTLSIGSQRHFQRVEFSNAIQTYTGLLLSTAAPGGSEIQGWYVAPVASFPDDRLGQSRNTPRRDREQWGRRIAGLHFRQGRLPGPVKDLSGAAMVYTLRESDRTGSPTPNRRYLTASVRLHRAPTPGRWDTDIEAAFRSGTRRETNASADTIDLRVRAAMLFATVGYTWPGRHRLRIGAELYWASGDHHPADGRYDQYERLFGPTRTDLHNTSIHGPLTPANLLAPAVRIEVMPSRRSDARIKYTPSSLASTTDV